MFRCVHNIYGFKIFQGYISKDSDKIFTYIKYMIHDLLIGYTVSVFARYIATIFSSAFFFWKKQYRFQIRK